MAEYPALLLELAQTVQVLEWLLEMALVPHQTRVVVVVGPVVALLLVETAVPVLLSYVTEPKIRYNIVDQLLEGRGSL